MLDKAYFQNICFVVKARGQVGVKEVEQRERETDEAQDELEGSKRQ